MYGFILFGCVVLVVVGCVLFRRLGKDRRSFRDTLHDISRDIAWRLNPMRVLRRMIDDAVDGYEIERKAMRTHKAQCDDTVVQYERKLRERREERRRREEEAGILKLREEERELEEAIRKNRREYELTDRRLRSHARRHPIKLRQLARRQKSQSSTSPRELKPFGQLSLEEPPIAVSTNTSKVQRMSDDIGYSIDGSATA